MLYINKMKNDVLSCFLYTKHLDFSYPFFLDEKRTKKIKRKIWLFAYRLTRAASFTPLCQFARISAKVGKPLLRNSKQIGIHAIAGAHFWLRRARTSCFGSHSLPLLTLRVKWPYRIHQTLPIMAGNVLVN